MKRSTCGLTLALLIAAALSTSAQNTPGGHALGIDVAGMDRAVRPQDDFFRFVNGAWADRTQIPPDMTTWGTFPRLRDDTAVAVRGLIEEAGAGPSERGSLKEKIGAYYRSFMDEARVEMLGARPLAGELEAVAGIKKVDDLPAAFVRAAQTGVRVPFAVTVGQDPRRSDMYIVLVSQARGVADISAPLDPSPTSNPDIVATRCGGYQRLIILNELGRIAAMPSPISANPSANCPNDGALA